MAAARIKLINHKRGLQVKQLEREIIYLLESCQSHTATIRVKAFEMEQKKMAAYDTIAIYCELIASRMPLIESQKNCPGDLKEAISSVIYASRLCTEIPELLDVRMHFISKYGKIFVSDAEFRSEGGANFMLMEKLSSKPPDHPTKIKILVAIAEEHNIKWKPNDIGQSTFGKAAYVEPSEVHTSPVHDDEGPANSCATSQLEPKQDASTHSYEQNASGSARNGSGNHSTTPGMANVEITFSEDGGQEMNFEDSYFENRSAFPVGKHLDMESKGATSAALADISSSLRAHVKSSDFDSYALVADSQKTTSTHEPHIQNKKSETKKKSSSLASIRYFDSDDSDSEDGLHKRNSASVAHPIRRICQRT